MGERRRDRPAGRGRGSVPAARGEDRDRRSASNGAPRTDGADAAEADCLRAARFGDSGAFGVLVERYGEALTRFLFVRTGNAQDAEELAQEAFLRAWQELGRYDERRRFSTWLFTLARRLAVSRHRAAGAWGRRPELGQENLAELPDGVDPAELASAREESHNLWRLAARVLPVEQRSALWLRYGEDLSVAEIAGILGRPRVTVRVLLFRARERLAQRLRSEEPRPSDLHSDGAAAPLASIERT